MRPRIGETIKAEPRRIKEGWFYKYIKEPIIDIGCQYDPITVTARRYDQIFDDGDATLMEGIPDNCFNTVYSSHILEHIEKYDVALKNWWRILRPGGNLIVLVPHALLYEKQPNNQPPSKWNGDHKFFFLPDNETPPRCLNFRKVIQDHLPEPKNIISFRVLDEGFQSAGELVHSVGEYSIEAIIQKP